MSAVQAAPSPARAPAPTAAQPPARRASNVGGDDGPQHGRRARRSSAANTADAAAAAAAATTGVETSDTTGTSLAAATHRQQQKTADTELKADVTRVQDEVDETTRQAQLNKMREEKERFAQKIAEAPTSYQASMPRLSDLDIKSSWDRLLRSIHSEYDMSCLTTCLSRELDEDETWNPEMLLVALTSDMLDANENKGGDVLSPVDPQAIGLMAGGEMSRKRKEKVAADTQAAPDKTPPAQGKQAFQKSVGSGKSLTGNGAAGPAAGRRAGGGDVSVKSPNTSYRATTSSNAPAALSSNTQELSRKESKKSMKEKEVSRKSSKRSLKDGK